MESDPAGKRLGACFVRVGFDAEKDFVRLLVDYIPIQGK
jgi:hypothetical protein